MALEEEQQQLLRRHRRPETATSTSPQSPPPPLAGLQFGHAPARACAPRRLQAVHRRQTPRQQAARLPSASHPTSLLPHGVVAATGAKLGRWPTQQQRGRCLERAPPEVQMQREPQRLQSQRPRRSSWIESENCAVTTRRGDCRAGSCRPQSRRNHTSPNRRPQARHGRAWTREPQRSSAQLPHGTCSRFVAACGRLTLQAPGLLAHCHCCCCCCCHRHHCCCCCCLGPQNHRWARLPVSAPAPWPSQCARALLAGAPAPAQPCMPQRHHRPTARSRRQARRQSDRKLPSAKCWAERGRVMQRQPRGGLQHGCPQMQPTPRASMMRHEPIQQKCCTGAKQRRLKGAPIELEAPHGNEAATPPRPPQAARALPAEPHVRALAHRRARAEACSAAPGRAAGTSRRRRRPVLGGAQTSGVAAASDGR